jgi:glutathione S-transferase
MYKLYWSPFTASLAPFAVLEETGAEYETEFVNYSEGQHKTPEYLAINPCGLVPAMTLPDGQTIFEAAAMIMHLCDRYSDAGLAPAADDPLRPLFYQWMLYLADTIQPTHRRLYHPERFSTDKADAGKVRDSGVEALLAEWRIVEDALAGKNWLLGERFSACDIYMQMLTLWFIPPEALYARYANIARVATAVAARPAVARVLETHER